MFPREGGDPVWAPAFAGEQELEYDARSFHHPRTSTTPAKAGVQLERPQ